MTDKTESLNRCVDHLNFTGGTCEDCKLPVDAYGNTENQFDYCSFPDCGCDGNRLCMANNGPSENSQDCNVEGMWSRKDKEALYARKTLIIGMALFGDKK